MSFKILMNLYHFFTAVFFNFGGLKLLKRKYKNTISERMGFIEDVPQNSIWVHAVSVGEVQSASSLIRVIKDYNKNIPCIISTVTLTGHDTAEKLLNGVVDKIIYSVWDYSKFVTRALNNINPKIYITMETELWPEILTQLKARNIPIYLANGRISEKSFKRYKKMSGFWKKILSCFNKLMVRFEEDKNKFTALGVPDEKIILTGDCKVDALLNRRNETTGEEWNFLKENDTKLFVAGSTHQGEDDVIISAFRILRRKFPNTKLIIVPRHPERALMSIASVLPYSELNAELFSKLQADENKNKNKNFDVIIIDKIGLLFSLYAAADGVFVGGSLVNKGGQNPFEPVLFGKKAIHGPFMTDFPDTERMNQLGAALCVNNDLELARAWEDCLNLDSRETAKNNCEKYFNTLGGAAKKTWDEILNDNENL